MPGSSINEAAEADMADVDIDQPGGRPSRRRRSRRRIRETTPASPEERAARRGPMARRAAARMDAGGPWQWQWRRRRRSRTMGCALWLLTLLAVLLVLALLFGGFQRGTKTGGLPAAPVPATAGQHSAG
jgi:hypothetical protein